MSTIAPADQGNLIQQTPDQAPDAPDFADERPLPGYVRVDLLPESVREAQRVRRAKRIVAVVFLVVVLIIAALWWMAQRDIQTAQEELEAAQATNAQLAAELNQYAEVPAVFAAAEAADQALSTAMAGEVRWSFLLNQLSFATPAGVTLNSVAGQIAEGGTVPNSPGGVLPLEESVGTMTFTGTADSFGDVAAWLNSLDGLQDYTYPFLTNSSKEETGGTIVWESTADLSTNALSGRYGTPTPGAGASDQPGGEATPAPSPAPTAEPSPSSDGAGEGTS